MSKCRHFAAVCYFQFNPEDLLWYVLGVTSISFPHEVKFPGGGQKKGEVPRGAAIRECFEESDHTCRPRRLVLMHTEKDHRHKRYFFATMSGECTLGFKEDPRVIPEAGGDTIITRWWKFEDFTKHVAPKYRAAWYAIFTKVAELDPNFAEDNYNFTPRKPAEKRKKEK